MKAEEMFSAKLLSFQEKVIQESQFMGADINKEHAVIFMSKIFAACIIAEAIHEAADKVVKAMGERG
jgi:hypothetical protein